MIGHLTEEGVSSFQIGFYVRYEDRFGNEEDLFGRECEVFIFKTETTRNQGVEDVFDSISESTLS